MEQCKGTNATRSIFQTGDKTTTERYTTAWIKLINLLEKGKN